MVLSTFLLLAHLFASLFIRPSHHRTLEIAGATRLGQKKQIRQKTNGKKKQKNKPTHEEQLGRRFRAKISLSFPHTRLRHMPFV